VFDGWRGGLEERLRSADLSPALEAHIAKYRSLMPSLALIFQLLSFVDGSGKGGLVETPSALRAVAWCDYLEAHAARLYSSAEDPSMEAARALLHRIKEGAVKDGETVREIYRKQWSRLSTSDAMNAATGILEDFGWLRVEKVGTGGRATTRIHLHPSAQSGS